MDNKIKSSLYAIKNEFTETFESFCKKYDERLRTEYEINFSTNNPLEVSFEIFCHLSYWARRINFYESNPFEKYFKYKDGKFQFCNYLLDFIDIFASDFVKIPESYPQEFVDFFLKTKSKSLKDKAYSASYYLSLAMLSMDNKYKKIVIDNNKTIRDTIKKTGYYKSLSDDNKLKFDKAILDKIDVINSIEVITKRNTSLEKRSGFYKNVCDSFLDFYEDERLSNYDKVDNIFDDFIKKYQPELYDKKYKWKSFKKTFYKYGYKLR